MKPTVCFLSICLALTSCVSPPVAFVRGDVEGSEPSRIRTDYKIGQLKTCQHKETELDLLFGLIKINPHTLKSMYNRCIDKAANEVGYPVIGFYESRGELNRTKIPGIITGGLIGIKFHKIVVHGQPYSSKDDEKVKQN